MRLGSPRPGVLVVIAVAACLGLAWPLLLALLGMLMGGGTVLVVLAAWVDRAERDMRSPPVARPALPLSSVRA